MNHTTLRAAADALIQEWNAWRVVAEDETSIALQRQDYDNDVITVSISTDPRELIFRSKMHPGGEFKTRKIEPFSDAFDDAIAYFADEEEDGDRCDAGEFEDYAAAEELKGLSNEKAKIEEAIPAILQNTNLEPVPGGKVFCTVNAANDVVLAIGVDPLKMLTAQNVRRSSLLLESIGLNPGKEMVALVIRFENETGVSAFVDHSTVPMFTVDKATMRIVNVSSSNPPSGDQLPIGQSSMHLQLCEVLQKRLKAAARDDPYLERCSLEDVVRRVQESIQDVFASCFQICCVCGVGIHHEGARWGVCNSPNCGNAARKRVHLQSEMMRDPTATELVVDTVLLSYQNGGQRTIVNVELSQEEVPHGYAGPLHFNSKKFGDGTLNKEVLQSVAEQIPDRETMLSLLRNPSSASKWPPLLLPLLQYGFAQLRTHIRYLSPGSQERLAPELFGDCPQFEVVMRGPQHARGMMGRKQVTMPSTFFAWATVKIASLYDALRQDWDSVWKAFGSAYGPGVYLAKTLRDINGFLAPGPRSNSDLLCGKRPIFLCEVVNSSPRYIGSGGSMIVVPGSSVVPRLLLLVDEPALQRIAQLPPESTSAGVGMKLPSDAAWIEGSLGCA